MQLSRRGLCATLLAAPLTTGCATMIARGKGRPYVLVHGAWHGAWCWNRTKDLLQADGVQVHTPTLTGVGERAHLLSSSVNLTTHIEDVSSEILFNDLSGIVLCGHSYAGMVISGVAERHADRIHSIVYLDAFVPRDGQSIQDIVGVAQLGIAIPPLPAAAMVNERDAGWLATKLTPQPGESLRERLKLTDAVLRVAQRVYIRAKDSPSPFFDAAYRAAQEDPAWIAREIAGKHDAMLDSPRDLAAMLREFA